MLAMDGGLRYGAIRTALIGYGVSLFSYLFARSGLVTEASAPAPGGWVSAFLLSGVGLQVLLILARVLIKHMADRDIATQALPIVELIGDGATVLLFALATFGAVVHAPEPM
jgi:hypothetical protein